MDEDRANRHAGYNGQLPDGDSSLLGEDHPYLRSLLDSCGPQHFIVVSRSVSHSAGLRWDGDAARWAGRAGADSTGRCNTPDSGGCSCADRPDG